MRARLPRVTLALLALLATGCCSTDPADLLLHDADDRREALACIAAEAEDEGDTRLKAAAVDAARRFSDPRTEPDPALRAASLRVLGYLQVRSAIPLLIARLVAGADADPTPAARVAAATVLGVFKGDSSTRALLDALRDRSREVRLAAARELLGAGPSADVDEALIGVLRDEAPEVRFVAWRSLRRRLGSDLGLDPETWSTWLRGRPRSDTGPAAPQPPIDEDVPELLGPDELMGPDEDEAPVGPGPDELGAPDPNGETPRDERPPLPPRTDPNPDGAPPEDLLPRPPRDDPGEGEPR
jgi:hypothetical protein